MRSDATDPPAETGIPIGPDAYKAWRATTLGAMTEAIEQRLIFELFGELEGRKLLDVGCGDGALVCAAVARGADAVGIDSDLAMLAAARALCGQRADNVKFLEGRAEHLPFADGAFDVVAAVTVLCFVPDAGSVVGEMARVLRPGGRLVIGELGQWNTWAALRRLRGWFGSRTWKHARFRSESELRALATRAGLTVMSVRGAVFYPPTDFFARVLAPVDEYLGRRTTFGAAFIALCAAKGE